MNGSDKPNSGEPEGPGRPDNKNQDENNKTANTVIEPKNTAKPKGRKPVRRPKAETLTSPSAPATPSQTPTESRNNTPVKQSSLPSSPRDKNDLDVSYKSNLMNNQSINSRRRFNEIFN